MQFDYKRAWVELAVPAYLALPQNVLDDVAYVAESCRDLHQNDRLDMVWPQDDYLKKRLEDTPDEVLSRAAQVVYNAGHWAWDHKEYRGLRALFRSGAHWKYSHYADQVLRERLSVPKDHGNRRGTYLQIIEGLFRMCKATRDSWEWSELCWATQSNLDAIRRIGASYDMVGDIQDQLAGDAMSWIDTMYHFCSPDNEQDALLLALRGVAPPEGWRVKELMHVNHRPHPFVIGTRHFTDSGRIDAYAAPCYYQGCNLSPDEHTSELAAALEYPRRLTQEEALAGCEPYVVALKRIAEQIGKPKLDGFAFFRRGRLQ